MPASEEPGPGLYAAWYWGTLRLRDPGLRDLADETHALFHLLKRPRDTQPKRTTTTPATQPAKAGAASTSSSRAASR
jgi:hypothetical protein